MISFKEYYEQPLEEGLGKHFTTAMLGISLLGNLESSADNEPFFQHFAQAEGIKDKIYKDSKGKPTIGIGHLLTADSEQLFKQLFGEKINFSDIVSGKLKLTLEQIKELFFHDIRYFFQKAKNIFPSFESYPTNIQIALLDGLFRGDLSGSPKTIILIKDGKWVEAAQEYLHNKEYLDSKHRGTGVAKRMENNANAFLKYAKL